MKKKVKIIAEAGVNHNGEYNLAIKLINMAKKAKADIVKFQTYIPNLNLSKHAFAADYQKKSFKSNINQIKIHEKFSLPLENFSKLKKYCDKSNIEFLSTPFDQYSINYLNKLGLKTFKIPSGEITNLPYLRTIGRLKKKIIISTGMSNLKEIDEALNILLKAGTNKNKITILHCNTEYPTPYIDVNLKAMTLIKETFDVDVGYSDHTLGIEVPIAAVALGATIIEKHITLDKKMQGPDHSSSLELNELTNMVTSIRNIEISLGKKLKNVTPSEKKNQFVARKSIVASKKILKGDIFSESNLIVKRPGTGINPMRWDRVIGKKAKKNYNEDDFI